MRDKLYWSLSEELDHQERVTLAWIQAVNMVCKTGIEVEYKKEVGYDSE